MKWINNYISEKLHIGKDYNFNAELKALIEEYFLTKFDRYVKDVVFLEKIDDIHKPKRLDVILYLKRESVKIHNLHDKIIPELCNYLHDYKYEYEFSSSGSNLTLGYQYFTIVLKNETNK